MQEIIQVQGQTMTCPIQERSRKPVGAQVPQHSVLTRDQYLELLKTARKMRKVLAYLAMRAIVSTGIQQQELLALTVEEVRTGEITTAERTVHLPDSLREELLDYARRNGVTSGAIFVGKASAITALSTVREQIKAVSRAAGMEDSEVSVRTLQELYETTRAEMMAQVTEKLMMEQLDAEQREHGWEN